jgi:hypothetical protein
MGRHVDDPWLRFDCWKFVLEQGHGRAPQALAVMAPPGNALDLKSLSDAELAVLVERLEAAGAAEAQDEVSPLIEGTATEVKS